MAIISKNSFGARETLQVDGKSYDYFSLEAASQAAGGKSLRADGVTSSSTAATPGRASPPM